MNTYRRNFNMSGLYAHRIKGITLLISLIFMALVGLLSAATLLSGNATVRATGDWVDRQKTINIADSALKIAENTIQDKMTQYNIDNSMEELMDDPANGFYLRAGTTAPPEWDPWPSNAIHVNTLDAQYFIIYEGEASLINYGTSNELEQSNYAHWFTIYARANGEREETQVILSLFKDFTNKS